ncbi:uncharacterized protein LOC111788335 isoform X1 [Cucurbita pepo subsp. pepo]|uniref:uncharacterized protein LOC111788335 isoform X1 n=1 Tax=Cucurbita pepo subsp. pepo TaxID=3664 RepID=UPI000C9DA589|nr:uncharacterized protein LOC111788335 isoform X1 [Cucurbita pepo subsp. pepo]
MASAALLALLRPRGTRGFLRPSVCFYFCNAVAWVVHSKGIVGLWGCPDRCNDSGSLGILGVDRLGFHLCRVCHGCWSSPPFDSLAGKIGYGTVMKHWHTGYPLFLSEEII